MYLKKSVCPKYREYASDGRPYRQCGVSSGHAAGYGEKNSVVMDGRDIGTVVLAAGGCEDIPDRISKKEREEDIWNGLQRALKTGYDEVYAEMIERDRNDSSRSIAPPSAGGRRHNDRYLKSRLDQSFEKVMELVERRS
jgi:cytidylate kinase